MSGNKELDENEEGIARLIFSIEQLADYALTSEKLKPEVREKFENAMLEMRPAFFILADIIAKAEYSEDGFIALWRLVSAALTIIDPEENKIGIAAALLSSSQSVYGKSSGVARYEKSKEIWGNQALAIAQAFRKEHPKSPRTKVTAWITARFEGPGCPGEPMLLKAIAVWEKDKQLAPRKK